MADSFFPNWLYQGLVDELLPWHQGKQMSFRAFNQKYTLHDSYWIGIFYNVGYAQAVTLAIQWDACWLPQEIKANSSFVNDWPYLFIRILGVEQIDTANYVEIGRICRAIAGCEFEEVEGKNFLAIDDVFGGQINIIYTGTETFLALNGDKSCLLL
ncbi:hypothetical protein NG798_08175 [Ancylothrix sp. C2]|uniref:hypothetical protein n=1 Tax=Ancylothrix sp. D3o TaxID=2953691 RepID=UPI0021BB4534|nr:hypothetical protein [Ancylothrix sp. D3o]MCT7949762.1 hypothetical protein [Ancylothrix sp. D3o]